MMRATMERDRGQLDEALARIEAGRVLSADDPSLDEVAAEIHEARGEEDEALRLYRTIATTTRTPQSIDGTARVLRAQGDTIAAAELVALARQSYDAQIAYFPEAAYGHAIDHWLRLEPGDVDRMITIAEGNAEARPYGETRVKLAMAYLLAGRTADARSVLDAVLATEWSTADLHGVNAIALAREGRDATSERAAAEAIAPGAMQRLAWLDQ
jgi:tetratricopeptide (TPR) repeat protein